MRKFKYVRENMIGDNLTTGKVYDVIEYINHIIKEFDKVVVLDDTGEIKTQYIYDIFDVKNFIDVTEEYRSEKIDEILK